MSDDARELVATLQAYLRGENIPVREIHRITGHLLISTDDHVALASMNMADSFILLRSRGYHAALVTLDDALVHAQAATKADLGNFELWAQAACLRAEALRCIDALEEAVAQLREVMLRAGQLTGNYGDPAVWLVRVHLGLGRVSMARMQLGDAAQHFAYAMEAIDVIADSAGAYLRNYAIAHRAVGLFRRPEPGKTEFVANLLEVSTRNGTASLYPWIPYLELAALLHRSVQSGEYPATMSDDERGLFDRLLQVFC